VLPVFIRDDEGDGAFAPGAAGRWWLHRSLVELDRRLGGRLMVFRGDPARILPDLVREHGAVAVHWNRLPDPWRREADVALEKGLGVEVRTFDASLLWEPADVHKADGTPYRVFTPFYRRGCLGAAPPRAPLPAPRGPRWARPAGGAADGGRLGLLPRVRWDLKLEGYWDVGERGAARRLAAFLEGALSRYEGGRDLPAEPFVSRLSPHLHWGEISPHQVWRTLDDRAPDANVEAFRRQLAWREFSHHLLHHFPELPRENLQSRFDRFPWEDDPAAVRAWRRGRTGIPFVDAGMRELWETGWMHNRVRMIVGSFLVKNLLQHWRHGERWFWDCLVDADAANNAASWQWVAGCGVDAAPYFRIFNPVTQGRRFDPDGAYTRRFVPELAKLPDAWLFRPWEAPPDILRAADGVLGGTYPAPVVDLKASRERALEAFRTLKSP